MSNIPNYSEVEDLCFCLSEANLVYSETVVSNDDHHPSLTTPALISIPSQPFINLLYRSCSGVRLLLCGYDGSADLRAAIPSQPKTIKHIHHFPNFNYIFHRIFHEEIFNVTILDGLFATLNHKRFKPLYINFHERNLSI